MKTSEAIKYDYRCPQCGVAFTNDVSRRGFVRHKERGWAQDAKGNPVRDEQGKLVQCRYGNRERD